MSLERVLIANRGEIVEILVQNNEFVEFEQPLMLIRPEIMG